MFLAVARIDWGRWVADCPNQACTNAIALTPGQATWMCQFRTSDGRLQGCGTTAPIGWPADLAAVEASVAGKPDSAQQWRPEPADD